MMSMSSIVPRIVRDRNSLLLNANNRLPDRKYPNSSSEAMKLMMFCTYLTSPQSAGDKNRVLIIEATTPNRKPDRVEA